MKRYLLCFALLASLPFAAKTADVEPRVFHGKFLFTDFNEVTSPCFKSNPASMEILESYTHCDATKGRKAPLGDSIGECRRTDGAAAYFFETLYQCKGARSDIVSGRNT